jgi:hypothetical protein
MKTVVWFGNAGSVYGNFGLPTLKSVTPALRVVAKEIPLRLLVISNDRAKFDAVTNGLPFKCEYLEWSRDAALKRISAADVCVVPNSRDRFSIAKSANRITLALKAGVPVVATATPTTEQLRPWVILDDWEGGLRTYLSDSARVRRDVAGAQKFIDANFSLEVLGSRWVELLDQIVTRKADVKATRAASRVIVFVYSAADMGVAESIAGKWSIESVGVECIVSLNFARSKPGELVRAPAQLKILSPGRFGEHAARLPAGNICVVDSISLPKRILETIKRGCGQSGAAIVDCSANSDYQSQLAELVDHAQRCAIVRRWSPRNLEVSKRDGLLR